MKDIDILCGGGEEKHNECASNDSVIFAKKLTGERVLTPKEYFLSLFQSVVFQYVFPLVYFVAKGKVGRMTAFF